jgi:hypothetical protein
MGLVNIITKKKQEISTAPPVPTFGFGNMRGILDPYTKKIWALNLI